MVKTFTNIWLDVAETSFQPVNLVSSTDTIHQYSEPHRSADEISIIASVQRMIATIPHDEAEEFKSPPERSFSNIFTNTKYFKPAFMHILEHCMTELLIIIGVNKPQVGEIETTPVMYIPIHLRFDLSEKNYTNVALDGKYTNMHKLQKDVKDVMSMINQVYNEMEIFSTCTALETMVNIQLHMKDDEEHLMARYQMLDTIYKNVQAELRNYEKNVRRKIFKELDDQATEATHDLKDLSEYVNAKTEYVQKWQQSREEQNLMRLQGRENFHKSTTEHYEHEKYCESIIHESVAKYYNEVKDDYFKQIEDLMAAYDKDLEDRDNTIYQMRLQLEKVQEEKNRQQKLYEDRNKAMEEWIEYKRKKREKIARQFLKNRAATKIQIWWRQVMVTRKLGPYRPKKGKKGDKKKKAGKNKK
ncbi:hypothetical protein Zmor_004996 [Zophobas morio]|uniref:Dynein regulatory complex protein 10 n=1 Tax=Zophobas morio TaxID=2755281 RepID=A0AA38IX10_9CUCU|nr:hypothetical protein Zmor_004996 [Zophobas morio]